MLGSLSKQEFNNRNTNLSLILVEFLVSAKFADLLVVKRLTSYLLHDLYENQLELNS